MAKAARFSISFRPREKTIAGLKGRRRFRVDSTTHSADHGAFRQFALQAAIFVDRVRVMPL